MPMDMGGGGFSGDGGSGIANPGLDTNSAQGNTSGFNPASALVPAGVAIGNWLSGSATNEANSAEAARNRAFAHDEANMARSYDEQKTRWQATTGYQNTMEDMRRAGLNPILAAKQGPEMGSGGGGSAASSPGNPVMQNAVGQGINSGFAAASLIKELQSADADITMKQAQALNAGANATYAASSARQTNELTAQLQARRGSNKAEATRDEGDYTWEDQNRTARMLTGKAGLGSALLHSADSADKMLKKLTGGDPTWDPRDPGSTGRYGRKGGYNEYDMLQAAKGYGVLVK